MKSAILFAMVLLPGLAAAQVTGFVQLRATHRASPLAECAVNGCATMVEEGLAELLFERLPAANLALSLRAEAVREETSRLSRIGLREGTIAWQPAADVDIKVGRQVVTWGVSDYLYVNDIFPKNYDAFFAGGSFDRIKEPVDAAHLTWHSTTDLDLVVSKAKADRMPSATRFAALGQAATAVSVDTTQGSQVDAALRASTSLGGWDLAGYVASLRTRETRLFLDDTGLRSDRPRLQHLGASMTGNAAGGVVWLEGAVRRVGADRNNVVDRHFLGSSAKFIAGYSRVVAEDVTASAQVQVESALDRRRYLRSLAAGVRPVAAFSPIVHVRVAGHWANQTLGGGAQLFAGAEGDTHFNPFANWSPADGLTLEAGANVFRGHPDTRFGVLKHDSNIYAAARYSY